MARSGSGSILFALYTILPCLFPFPFIALSINLQEDLHLQPFVSTGYALWSLQPSQSLIYT